MFMNDNFDDHDILDNVAAYDFTTTLVSTGIDASTRLATRDGRKAARDIKVGDEVLTFDNGLRTVRSIDRTFQALHYDALPILVPAGALGNQDEFTVPQNQVLMIESDRAEMLFGDPFALVRAEDLVGYNGICRVIPVNAMDVVIIDFGTDEVVFGAKGELFFCPVAKITQQRSDIYAAPSSYTVLDSKMVVQMTAEQDPAPVGLFRRDDQSFECGDVLVNGECLAA